MYLLGVMDATEGKAGAVISRHCRDRFEKASTAISKSCPTSVKQPAAMLITEALAKELPCKQGATS